MKNILTLSFCVFFCFFLNHTTLKAQSWATQLNKSEKLYQQGKYNASLKSLRKTTANTAWKNLQTAKILIGKGEYASAENAFTQALSSLESIQSSEPTSYIIGQLHAVEVLLQLKRAREASLILEKLQQDYASLFESDAFLKAELDFYTAETLLVQGFNRKAHQKAEQTWQFWSQVSLGQISKTEANYYNTRYVQTISLKAKTFAAQGQYPAAVQWLAENHKNAKNATGTKHYAYALFLKTWGDILFEQDIYKKNKGIVQDVSNLLQSLEIDAVLLKKESYTTKTTYEIYKAALKTTKANLFLQKSFDKSSKDFLDIWAQYVRTGFREKRRVLVKEDLEYWDKILYAFYKGRHPYKIYGQMLEAEFDIFEERYQKAEKALTKTHAEAEQILPTNHPLLLQITDLLFQLHTLQVNDAERAEEELYFIGKTITDLAGKETPLEQLYQIRKAVFLMENTDSVTLGKDIIEFDMPEEMVLAEIDSTHPTYVQVLNHLIRFYDVTEDYDTALVMAEHGLEILEAKYGDSHLKVGQQRAILAKAQLKKGLYQQAEANAESSMRIIGNKINRNSIEYAQAVASTAQIYGVIGDYAQAETLLKRSSRIYNRNKADISQNAQAIEELAFLYIRIGKFAQTEEILEKTITQKTEKYGENSRTLINPLNRIAELYLIKGDYGKAEKAALKAADITRMLYEGNTLKLAESYSILGKLYLATGDYLKAEEYLQDVLKLQQKLLGEEHIATTQTLTNLALAKFYQNPENLVEVENLLTQVRDITLKTFDSQHPLYLEAVKNLAFIAIAKGELDQAIADLQQIDAIWRTRLGSENVKSAEIAVLLGDVYSRQKNFTQANLQYNQAQKLYEKIFSQEHPSYVQTLSKQGLMFYVSGDYKKANTTFEQTTAASLGFIQKYFPSMSQNEKGRFWALMRPDFEFFNTLAIAQAQSNPALLGKMYDFTLATKGLLLSSSLKVRQRILNSGNQALIDKYKEWVNQKEFLTSVLSMSAEQLKLDNIKPNEIAKEVERLEKELSEASEVFASATEQQNITWQDVQKQLKYNEAAVEIIRFRHFDEAFTDSVLYAALIVTAETKNAPQLVILPNGNDLENKFLNYYRSVMKLEKEDRYSYANYWQPLEQALAGKDIVYFSPDGAYNQLNPESFQKSQDLYVIDEVNVRIVSNTKDIVLIANKPQNTGSNEAILVGNPQFYASLDNDIPAESYVSELPGTQVEVENIKNLLSQAGWYAVDYTQTEATKETVKKIESPKVFHIATHGFFLSNVKVQDLGGLQVTQLAQSPLLRSGLLMYGAGDALAKGNVAGEAGILTAADAASLNFDNTELVVLSACETGAGEVEVGEGVFGLQRSFLVAGADALIMSLFKVSDDVTQELMVKFYEKWLATGDKRQAFNEAQKEIKQKYPHPRYWGAFNMIGVK